MSDILTCRICGDVYTLPAGEELRQCPSCGTVNARPQAEGEALDKLQRATRLRLKGEYAEALRSYEHVLLEYDDEHEALWGKLLCQYGVEFVIDPKTGVRHATVHVPSSRPMQMHADFERACELAPEVVRAQYEAEAAYVDEALAEINRRMDDCEPYDIFVCHKTTHLNSDGYTEDYNRAMRLSRRLEKAGYSVFFAPFSDMEPGASYEAGIYYALATAKVMLLISSDPAFLNSPWVKSEWTRYLEMLDDGADKHLIPLMYGSLTESRMPREIRLRRLQAIRMEDFDAPEKLMAALKKFTGKGAGSATAPVAADDVVQDKPAIVPVPVSVPRAEAALASVPAPVRKDVPAPVSMPRVEAALASAPAPVRKDVPAPVSMPRVEAAPAEAPAPVPKPTTTPVAHVAPAPASLAATVPEKQSNAQSCYVTEVVYGGCVVMKYNGPDGSVTIPREIGGQKVISIGAGAFASRRVTEVTIPEGVRNIGLDAFAGCTMLRSAVIPATIKSIGDKAFDGCPFLLLKVEADSPAHTYAKQNAIRYELIPAKSVPAPDSVTKAAQQKRPATQSAYVTESIYGGCVIMKYKGPDGSVTIPQEIGGQKVISIGAGAFASRRVTEVTIPEGVRNIGLDTFADCTMLRRVVVPSTVKSIGDKAFEGCPFLLLQVEADSPAHDYAKQNSLRYELAAVKPAPAAAPISKTPPAPVRQLRITADSRFVIEDVEGGVCITSYKGRGGHVDIPARIEGKEVVEISGHAFEGCEKLSSVHIPAGVRRFVDFISFGENPFAGVPVGEEFRTIFGWDSDQEPLPAHSMTKVVWNDNPFQGCPALRIITAADGNASFYVRNNVLFSCENRVLCYPPALPATTYEIPAGTKIIAGAAFAGCVNLKRVVLPAGVREVWDRAFDGCTALQSIAVPGSLLAVDSTAFDNCPNLTVPFGLKVKMKATKMLSKIL